MIKGVLFDKDGTLIDFTETFGPATAAVIRTLTNGDEALAWQMAKAVDFDLDEHTFMPSSVIIAGTCAEQAAIWGNVINRSNIDELAEELDRLFARYATEFVSPFAYTAGVLDHLKMAGFAVGLATNDSETGARNQLEKMRFTEHFGFIAGYDSGHGPKPEAGMVSAFISHIGAEPHEVLMVGDSTHDIHSGKAAGAITIAVTTGMASADDLRPHADHVLSGIHELPELIAQLNQA